jgi:hypothetical protein
MPISHQLKFMLVLPLLWAMLVLGAWPVKAATTLLPTGEQCFQKATGPISSGSINMYIPSTTTTKTTWKDSGQITANTNPIQLDANGCAIIYGTGSYRQQVFDGPVVGGVTTGNLIFDLTTTDTSATNNVFWAALAGGTPNAITVVDAGFNSTDGSVINFTALSTNTGATTLNPSGVGNIPVLKISSAGPVALSGGEIVANNPTSVIYSATLSSFVLLTFTIPTTAASTAPLCGAIGYAVINDGGTPNTKLDITATTALTVTPTGTPLNRSTVSLVLNFGVNGANGLDQGALGPSQIYYIYLIDNGSTIASLASLSSTAPLMPSGYTYVCRMSAAPSTAGSILFQIQTNGDTTIITSAIAAGSPFFVAASTGTCVSTFTAEVFSLVPTTAQKILGRIHIIPSQKAGVSRGGVAAGTLTEAENTTSQVIYLQFTAPVISGAAQTVYYCSDSASNDLIVFGWADSVNAH